MKSASNIKWIILTNSFRIFQNWAFYEDNETELRNIDCISYVQHKQSTALNVLTAHFSEYTVGFWFDNPPNILEFNPEQHRSPVYTRLTEHELGQLVYDNSHHTELDRSITVLWVLGHVPNLINIAPKLRWLRLSAFTEEVRNLSLFRILHERWEK